MHLEGNVASVKNSPTHLTEQILFEKVGCATKARCFKFFWFWPFRRDLIFSFHPSRPHDATLVLIEGRACVLRIRKWQRLLFRDLGPPIFLMFVVGRRNIYFFRKKGQNGI